MKCSNMIFLDPFTSFPCGKCYVCRIKKTREWQTRLLQEMNYWESSLFVTLTYDEEHLPEKGNLVPRHLVNWLKSYRKEISKYGRVCKYYSVGEYGDEFTTRAHYHIILFGAVLEDFVPHGTLHGKYKHASWPNGFIDLGTVTPESIAYVVGYVRKKLSAAQERELSPLDPRVAPFQRQSQGLGLRWAQDNRDFVEDNQVITVNGVKRSIPRYYVRKLDLQLEDRSELVFEDWDEAWERYWTKRRIVDEGKRAELYSKMLQQNELNLRAKFERKKSAS